MSSTPVENRKQEFQRAGNAPDGQIGPRRAGGGNPLILVCPMAV